MKVRFTIKLTNSQSKPLNMLLEPWAEEIHLLQGESASLSAVGPEPAELEIDASDNGITIFGWPGSICELTRNPADQTRSDG